MTTLDMRKLFHFVAVAEELNFTRAAARLQMSQFFGFGLDRLAFGTELFPRLGFTPTRIAGRRIDPARPGPAVRRT